MLPLDCRDLKKAMKRRRGRRKKRLEQVVSAK